jgi:hypothetical protein
MVRRAKRKGNGAARPDPNDAARRQEKALLQRAIKHERTITALNRRLQRETHKAEASSRQLQGWLRDRYQPAAPDRVRSPGDGE